MAEFAARHDMGIRHAADVDGVVWQANNVRGQPAWVFVDGETGTSTTQFGGLGVDGLTAAVEQLRR